jgi:hypothetical protein
MYYLFSTEEEEGIYCDKFQEKKEVLDHIQEKAKDEEKTMEEYLDAYWKKDGCLHPDKFVVFHFYVEDGATGKQMHFVPVETVTTWDLEVCRPEAEPPDTSQPSAPDAGKLAEEDVCCSPMFAALVKGIFKFAHPRVTQGETIVKEYKPMVWVEGTPPFVVCPFCESKTMIDTEQS